MTEEEAKTKWCPMVRMNLCYEAGKEVGSWNRDGGDCMCIASDCMMWRRDKKYSDEYYCGLGGKL